MALPSQLQSMENADANKDKIVKHLKDRTEEGK